MEIIVTHLSADFDSFAGMVAAKKLFPEASIVLPTAINSNVRKFISLYEDELPLLVEAGDLDFKEVKKLIMIDTRLKEITFFAATMPAKESKSALRWVTIISINSGNFIVY